MAVFHFLGSQTVRTARRTQAAAIYKYLNKSTRFFHTESSGSFNTGAKDRHNMRVDAVAGANPAFESGRLCTVGQHQESVHSSISGLDQNPSRSSPYSCCSPRLPTRFAPLVERETRSTRGSAALRRNGDLPRSRPCGHRSRDEDVRVHREAGGDSIETHSRRLR